MNTKICSAALAAVLALALGGCMVGPNYVRPKVPVPAHYQELSGWVQAAPNAAGPKGEWWKAFHDPLLDKLEPAVAVSNQTVREDYANYQEALAEVKVARSGLFPTIGVAASATRQRSNRSTLNGNNTFGGNIANFRPVATSGSLEGSVSWAPDLWGKVRRDIQENRAMAQASEATLANATLSEQVALASAVIDLRVTDADINLLRQTVAAYKHYLRVVEIQRQAGTKPPSDEIIARTQLENTESSLIALGVARARDVHAIAILVGKNPEDLSIPHSASLPTLPEIPVGVPSTLLERRPDIAVAERQMAAANAAIGVTEAAFFPSLSLSGAAGFAQSPLAGLLHAANYVWSLGADLGATLFAGGERHGEVAAAKANYDAAIANYRGTVLAAFEGVENDLAGLRILAQQANVLDAAVKNATRGAQIARNEYQAGTVDFTTVAVAQATALSTRQNALDAHQQRLLDAVSLIGDLGGGWPAGDLSTTPVARATHRRGGDLHRPSRG